MDLAGKARRIERTLARTVDAAIGELVGRDEPAPLEMIHAVLDRAEQEVQEIGRGRRVFPFTRVRLLVAAASRDRQARARVEAVLAGPPSLAERLDERLRAAGCAAAPIATELAFVTRPAAGWDYPRFHVTFDRGRAATAAAEESSPGEPPRLKLTVLKGRAPQRAYAFAGGRIDIGRRSEVVDHKQRVIRTNHVAFADDDAEDNGSVSRRHAHIEFIAAEGSYRLWDDGSAHGTCVVRGGRSIKVLPGARGARLAAGDEIVLGRARLRVEIR